MLTRQALPQGRRQEEGRNTEYLRACRTGKRLERPPGRMNKLDHPELIQCFHHIRANAWITGEAPQQCEGANILHKKKYLSGCNNYGGISLVDHIGNGLLRASFPIQQLRRGSANTP